MRIRLRSFAWLFLALAVSWAGVDRVSMPTEIGVSSRKHKPFTATARTTLSRVFASGVQRTVTTEDRIARDGEGRVFREQHAPWTEDPAQPVYYVNILDPKKMERIHLDSQMHTALVTAVDQRYAWDYVPYDGTQYKIKTKPGVTVRTELLGNKEINGWKCWGQRTTYVFEPGTYQGNQQTMTRTSEIWYAKDLGADVRIENHDPDPKAGDQQTDLVDVKDGDPDAAMFAAPAAYSVQGARP